MMMKKPTSPKNFSGAHASSKVSFPSNVSIVEKLATLLQNVHTRNKKLVMKTMEKDGKGMVRNSLKRGITSIQKKKTPLQKRILMRVTMKKCCSSELSIRASST